MSSGPSEGHCLAQELVDRIGVLEPTKQPYSLLKFTSLLMIGALLGKIFGFAREILFARQLGAGVIADSFRGAISAVLLPIAPLQGDMSAGALVPLHKMWQKEGRAPQMFASLSVMLGLLTCGIMVGTYLISRAYVDWLVNGFDEQAKTITIRLVHVMVLSMPASVLFNCLACIELSIGRVRLAVIRASVQNVSVICGIFIMIITKNPLAIAWGFSIAMNLSTFYGFFMLCKEGELAPLAITLSSCIESFTVFFKRIRALFSQPIFEQSNIILEKFLGSMLITGTIASLDYARTLTDTAGYFVSQPIGLAVLRRDAASDPVARVKMICKPILHIALPVSAFTVIFATDLVTVVFKRGAFQQEAITLTSGAMEGIAFGIWASVIGWILVRMLNAAHQNLTVAKICMVAYAMNMLVNICTFKFFGSFGLGLGEATRGIVLLAGTSYALNCGKVMLRLVAEALPITAILSIAGLGVLVIHTTPIWRVSIGFVVFAVPLAIYLMLLFPQLAVEVLIKLRRIKGRIFRSPAVP